MGNADRKEWRRMIDIQVPMMRWTRSRELIALLEEIGAPKKLTTPLTVKTARKRPVAETIFW
jgi:hypothetical protein